MSHRFFASIGAIASVMVLVFLAQIPLPHNKPRRPPKRLDADPHSMGRSGLRAVSLFSRRTRLERPQRARAKDTFTEARTR